MFILQRIDFRYVFYYKLVCQESQINILELESLLHNLNIMGWVSLYNHGSNLFKVFFVSKYDFVNRKKRSR